MSIEARQWLARPRNLSDEGIHSDEAARRLGFAGGFVPGVSLYAHVVAELLRQGADWLCEGSVAYRFRRPVYDGEEVRFAVDADSFAITPRDDGADVRASGQLSLTDAVPEVPRRRPVTPDRAALGDRGQIGVPLQIRVTPRPERIEAALAASGEFDWREGERTLLPVSLWLNPIDLVRAHYEAAVTIHVGGRVWHHAPVYVGETVVKRGAITGFEERRGNSLVTFLVAIETVEGRPVATVEHTSVYALARAQEAVG
jgi:acyl dehydratase